MRANKRRLRHVLAAAVLASACGCGSAGGPSAPKTLDVLNWLTASSEKSALAALFKVVESRDPGVAITNAAQDRSDVAQQELANEMAKGNPPDSFQVVSGSDLDSWVQKGALEPLDALAAAQGWTSVIPAPVLQSVSSNGSLYGVPLDIERDNTLFYNKQVFAAHGVTPPTHVADVLTAAAALKAAGVASPLAVSASAGWTIASHVFESVLVDQAGPDFYQAYLTGKKTPDTPELRAALASVSAMMTYANPDRTSTEWAAAVARVCSGEAAMLILPDFVKGEFANDGCGPSAVSYVPMQPAGIPTFVFVSITFELPNGAPHRDAAIQFLETVGSKAGQEAFNPIKGSIPARTDADPRLFDQLSAQTLADFTAKGERLVPAYAALTPPNFQTTINDALKNFVDPASDAAGRVDVVITSLTQNYSKLSQP